MFEDIHHVHTRYLELLAKYREWQKNVDKKFPNSDYTKKTLPPIYHPQIDIWEIKLGVARYLLGIEPAKFEMPSLIESLT